MKRWGFKVFSIILAACMMASLSMAYAADKDSNVNRYNVVFVTDESGSMKHTDPEQLRYEAIRRFTGLTTQTGNFLGSVNFDDKIVDRQNVSAMEGFSQKNNFVNKIASVKSDGNTNIGLGLSAAIDTLDANRNTDLPSAIILLTDGNTRMDTAEQEKKSLELKADAIERARQAGYVIYTICLNTDGSADTSEMKQIASATGGEFSEVTNPEDLADVETMYYKMIFGGIESNPDSIAIENNGMATKAFEVPAVGVEEFNIIFEGEFTKCEVTDPKGHLYTGDELKSMSMSGKGFSLVKVSNPVGGTWNAKVYGKPGTTIKVKLLHNTDFCIETSISPESDYNIGETVAFHAQVCDARGIIDNPKEYQGFHGKVHISGNGEETEFDMKLGKSGFTYDYIIPDEGTYYATITVGNGEMSADSGKPYEISVNNAVPSAPKEKPHVHIYRWPFVGGTASLDLNGTATDPDNEALTYSVESTAFNKEDYGLDGTVLKVEKFSVSKGSFTIRATDPHGAYCTFDVLITSTNIGLIMAIVILGGGLLVFIVAAVIVYKKKLIPFMGTITVEKFDDESNEFFQPNSQSPGRGSVRLENFVYDPDFPKGCKFQAGGKKKEIYFVSKKPVYSNVTGGARKKIAIEGSGSEIRISADPEMSKGIVVSFKSLLYNPF